jgi:hypothetical protein
MKVNELKIIICVLLFLILPEFHLLLNNLKPINVDLFLFCDKIQDIQWYVKDTFDIFALISLSFAILIAMPKNLKSIGWALILINIAKIPLYWAFYLQFDWAINIIIFSICYLRYLNK